MSRLLKKLLAEVARASATYGLIEPDDRVMVAVSGGKDSHALLYLLREIQRRAPFSFSLVAVTLDQGQPDFPAHVLAEYFAREGYEHRVVREDTYSIVKEKIPEGRTYCSLCSRLRRGVLYNIAQELGATKIALGHHRDDAIETLLLNVFYSGQIKAMPPRLRSDDGRNVVIRPLIGCAEADLAALATERGFPIVPCDLCGSQEQLKRKRMKRLIDELAADNPAVRGNLVRALANVRPSHLLDQDLRRALGIEEALGDEPTEAPAPVLAPERLLGARVYPNRASLSVAPSRVTTRT
jgi:tRNA 2-thiocytidine biosynthesis protein TtcA